MMRIWGTGAIAGAALATALVAAPAVNAKPIKMCFKTGNGKNYLAVNPSNGFLDGKSKSCAGNAVFSVDYFTLNKNAPPRVGPPIVIRAANGKYVRFNGRTLRAVAPRIRPNDRYYMFAARASHGGIRGGAVMAPGMRINLYPMMSRFWLMTAAQNGGGGWAGNLRRFSSRHPAGFYTLTAAGAKPKGKPKPTAFRPNHNWVKMSGRATDAGAGADGALWVVGTDKNAYEWVKGKWRQMPSFARDIGVAADGTVTMIGPDSVPYRWDGKGNWRRLPGSGQAQLDAGPKGTFWIVGHNRQIWNWNGKGWSRVQGPKARDIGVGPKGRVFIVGMDGKGYVMTGPNKWAVNPKSGGQMAVTVRNGMPLITNSNTEIWLGK